MTRLAAFEHDDRQSACRKKLPLHGSVPNRTGQNPIRVSCSGGIQFYKDGRETLDNATLVLESANGVSATHTLPMFHSPESSELRVLGMKGVMCVRNHKLFESYLYGQTPHPVAFADSNPARVKTCLLGQLAAEYKTIPWSAL